MTGIMDTVEIPKLPENQKTFAGIPEAIFLVSIMLQASAAAESIPILT